MAEENIIPVDSYVWREGMSDWYRLSEILVLAAEAEAVRAQAEMQQRAEVSAAASEASSEASSASASEGHPPRVPQQQQQGGYGSAPGAYTYSYQQAYIPGPGIQKGRNPWMWALLILVGVGVAAVLAFLGFVGWFATGVAPNLAIVKDAQVQTGIRAMEEQKVRDVKVPGSLDEKGLGVNMKVPWDWEESSDVRNQVLKQFSAPDIPWLKVEILDFSQLYQVDRTAIFSSLSTEYIAGQIQKDTATKLVSADEISIAGLPAVVASCTRQMDAAEPKSFQSVRTVYFSNMADVLGLRFTVENLNEGEARNMLGHPRLHLLMQHLYQSIEYGQRRVPEIVFTEALSELNANQVKVIKVRGSTAASDNPLSMKVPARWTELSDRQPDGGASEPASLSLQNPGYVPLHLTFSNQTASGLVPADKVDEMLTVEGKIEASLEAEDFTEIKRLPSRTVAGVNAVGLQFTKYYTKDAVQRVAITTEYWFKHDGDLCSIALFLDGLLPELPDMRAMRLRSLPLLEKLADSAAATRQLGTNQTLAAAIEEMLNGGGVEYTHVAKYYEPTMGIKMKIPSRWKPMDSADGEANFKRFSSFDLPDVNFFIAKTPRATFGDPNLSLEVITKQIASRVIPPAPDNAPLQFQATEVDGLPALILDFSNMVSDASGAQLHCLQRQVMYFHEDQLTFFGMMVKGPEAEHAKVVELKGAAIPLMEAIMATIEMKKSAQSREKSLFSRDEGRFEEDLYNTCQYVYYERAKNQYGMRHYPTVAASLSAQETLFMQSPLAEGFLALESMLVTAAGDDWPARHQSMLTSIERGFQEQAPELDQFKADLRSSRKPVGYGITDKYRRILLSLVPRYIESPRTEVNEGWTETVIITTDQKKEGPKLNFRFTVPASWSPILTDESGVIYAIASECGFGSVKCSLSLPKLDLRENTTTEDWRAIVESDKIKSIVPVNGRLISSDVMAVAGQEYCARVVYDFPHPDNGTRLGPKRLVYVRLLDGVAVQMTTEINPVRGETRFIDELDLLYKHVFESMINSMEPLRMGARS